MQTNDRRSDFVKSQLDLAQTDLEQFKRECREKIEKIISQAPPHRQKHLRRIQWRIDVERKLASSLFSPYIPLGKVMRILTFLDKGQSYFKTLFREAGIKIRYLLGVLLPPTK